MKEVFSVRPHGASASPHEPSARGGGGSAAAEGGEKGPRRAAASGSIGAAGRLFRGRQARWASAAAGAGAAFLLVILSGAFRPRIEPLARRDVAKLIEEALAEQRSRPSEASLAYEAIRPSLVVVRGLRADSDLQGSVAVGAGVVVEDSGTILTALHVVREASAIEVTFADGFSSDAVIVGAQPENDLAVLDPLVAPENLKPATLAGSGHLRVGDQVVAVGNPFGMVNSASAGVVSGLGRSFVDPRSGATMENLIQFDAAVNPGNSGGPLLDRNGEVVGIVCALLNPTDQEFFVGIGFAVTIETASSALGLPPW